jgi:hypothetical protein
MFVDKGLGTIPSAQLCLRPTVGYAGASNLLETTNTVKWFNSQKGYGFIQPQDGGVIMSAGEVIAAFGTEPNYVAPNRLASASSVVNATSVTGTSSILFAPITTISGKTFR